MAYVYNLRREEAKKKRERENLSIEAIANEEGYEDRIFSRLFRRGEGLTPIAFRLRIGDMRKALAADVGEPYAVF